MLQNKVTKCLWVLATSLVVGSCAFSSLKSDLEKRDATTHVYAGTITAPDMTRLLIVAIDDLDGAEVSAFRLASKSGPYQLRISVEETYLFGFEDQNLDFTFQADEKFGWGMSGQLLSATDHADQNIEIIVDSTTGPPLPRHLVDKPLREHLDRSLQFNKGTVTELDHNLLSLEQAKKGLWLPFAFVEDGGAGIHFLEDYDRDRIPVLFVHGVQGSPVNFAPLIEKLDRTRYQAWFFSYPSGWRLTDIASGLFQFVQFVQRTYGFRELHIVAHSMGGLVSRGTLNICVTNDACKYIKSLTTISTPWNGVESAASGVAWAPTVVPVWLDLDPTSEYLTTLFDTPLPGGVPHNLLFGYHLNSSIFGNESSDGVITLFSQLREEAQAGATVIHGYNEGHVDILGNDNVAAMVNLFLSGQ